MAPTLPFGLRRREADVHDVQVPSGSTVYLFSDGIVEAQNAAGRRFEASALVGILERHACDGASVLATCRGVLDSVVEYVGTDLSDDATILGACVQW